MTEKNGMSPRRALLQTGLGLLGAGVATHAMASGAMASGAMASGKPAQVMAQEKLAHALVQYQDGPKDGLMCSKCAQFQAPNACAIVVSPIAPAGWCVAYAPKEG